MRDPSGPQPNVNETQRIERRLEDIAQTIMQFAELHFDARALVGPDGDIVDAVAAGVNFLGEELAASFGEVERRVADRTAELAKATEELSRQALHDTLTGVGNRAALWERVAHRLAVADRRQTSFAILFLDVDRFKSVNDTHGHGAGDRLLVDIASRLTTQLRVGDTVARVGGDEFVVLFDEIETAGAVLPAVTRVHDALQAPYEIAGASRKVAVSIGVAVGPGTFHSADDLIAAADTAMYAAKHRGGGRFVVHGADPDGSGR